MRWAAYTQLIPTEGDRSHTDLETSQIVVDGADVDEARAALEAELPTGWRLLSIRQV